MNESEARQFSGIPGELLERERQLRIDVAALDRRVTEAELDPDAADDASRSVDRNRLFDRKREYEALLQRLEKQYPRYFDLKYRFATASAEDVRERLLDERTALVEYFVGRDRLFVFVVTKRGLSASSVAKDASFEKAVEELRGGIAEQDFARYARSARQLYETLLAPVEGVAAGKDLVIVPDGPLSTIPFEALLTRDVGSASGWADAGSLPYLIRDRAVRYAYSATMLIPGLRREKAPPEKDYVAFAPVFSTGRPESEGGARDPRAAREAPSPPRATKSPTSGGFSASATAPSTGGSPRGRACTSRAKRPRRISSTRVSSTTATCTSRPTVSSTRSIPGFRVSSSRLREARPRTASSTSARSTTSP